MLRKFVHQKLVLLTLLLVGTVCSYSQNTSNKGRDFWVGYGHHQFMEQGNNLMNMRLYFSTEGQAATVTVTIDSSGSPFIPPPGIGSIWTKTYTIPPYTAIQSDIIPKGPVNAAAAPGDAPSEPNWDARLYDLPPASGGAGGSGIFRKKGIHIVSSVPITAYAHIYGSASSGATMLIPITAWGYEYVSLNSNQSYGSDCYSWTYVVAYKDNTVVQITPSVKTRGQNRTGLLPGVTTTVTLMKGQIYQLIGANLGADADGNGGTDGGGHSLSGTRIKSVAGLTGECFPVAVFAGSSRTANVASCGSGGGDNDNQQLFPMHSWGKKYATAPFSNSTTPSTPQTSIVKVAFSEPPPATQLRRNGVVVPVPAGSLFYTYESNTADLLEATKPIMVNQFMTGGACSGGGLGDPEMVVVAPMEQAIKEVTFYRQSRQSITTNYLTLVVPTAGLASLRIDNSTTFDLTYPHPQNALLSQPHTVVVKRWNIGAAQGFQSHVKCDSGFNAITYGLGSVESYAYSAGALINNLNALTGIHNQPDNSGSTELHKFTGVGTPMDLSILIKYQPDRLTWKFSEMNPLPGACMTVNPPLAGDYVMNPASGFADGTVVVNGITYYKYKLPQTFTFNCAGTYEIPVEAYSTGIANCGNREMFYPAVEVKQKLVVDYTYQNQTLCTKDTVYLFGPASGLSGIEPFTTTQWRWVLPGGVRSTHQDTAIVLPPGTHELKLVAISPDGLLSDTVRKTVTIYPPPTTVLNGTPDVLCIGQTVNFTQIPTYGGVAPITNYYWNYGEGTPLNNNNNTGSHTYTTAGTYTAQAAVRVSDLCIGDTTNKIITVNPEAKIAFTFPTTCLPGTGIAQFGAATTDLGGTPITNYTWNFGDPSSGPNNTSSQPNPQHTFSSFGQYTITLSITTSTGCTGDTTKVLNFDVAPILAYAPFTPVCTSVAPFSIATGNVTNGVTNGTATYSGPGVNSTTNMFDPVVAGPGIHTIRYTYTTASCSETTTQNVTVLAPPVVGAGNYGPFCVNAASVNLAGSPAGGTFSGTGVSGTTFNPATAGIGIHTITYAYTDAGGCSNTTTTNIEVYALPAVNPGTYAPVCISATAVTLAGTPAGGAFTGPGVTGNTFNPATAGAGSHTIRYTYTDAGGCVGTNTTTIVVNALPVVDAGTYTARCINAAAVTLAGTPAGGTFSGPGVTGITFNPATAGVGSHTIIYNYTDANGCAASDNATIVVNALPVVNAGTYAPVCANAATITLAGTPAGGTFSGTGVTGTTFNPALGVAGPNTITYTYTDGNGCTNAASAVITVNALPVVDAGTYAPRCINAAALTLAGTPAGGTFSGPGVTGTTFNPATAGMGSHTIIYNYTNANGCAASDNATIVVNALPVVDAGTYTAACLNGGTITLAGTPAGGTFSGPAVTGTTFNPATAGIGSHTITYTYTDPNGCASSDMATIVVNALGTVDAGTYPQVCVAGASITLAGTPAGGTFTGPGVTGTTFNPATAGVGTHRITYVYTDANGCNGTDQTDIVVYALPTVSAGTYNPVCIDAAPVTLAGTPAGGTFSGLGVTGNTFNPATAGAGSHNITYNYTDASGCSASDIKAIVVNALPVADAGTYAAVCANVPSVALTGTPSGGTFSGTGVAGNTFTPSGAGTTIITYNYVDANGCTDADVANIVVNALPVVNPGTYAAICSDAAPVTLAGTPAGGTFSGPGVSGNTFTPATAGPGTHSISYSFTDANGCSASRPTNITVHALPSPAAGVYAPVCINAAPITLAGTPAGGTFSGPGVAGNSFTPATAGPGSHQIRYTYTNANGCTSFNETNIAVNAMPVVSAGTYAPICAELAPITLTGTPAGGTFSGPGVAGNTFNPGAAAAGNNLIMYSFTSGAGCTSTQSVNIRVNPTPTSTFTLDNSICLNETTTLQSTGTVPTGNIASYTWTFGDTRPSETYNNANPLTVSYTTYNNYSISLVTTSNLGCVSRSTTAQIGVHPLPVINFGLPTGICMPEGLAVFTNNTTVPDNSALSYVWNFGDFSVPSSTVAPSHTYATAQPYDVTLTATSAFGCVNQSTQILDDFFNKPVASFNVNPAELCQGERNTFRSTSSDPAGLDIIKWQWNFGDNTSPSGSANPTKTYTLPGDYTINLVVTNEVGCVSDPYPQSVKVYLQPVIDAGKSFTVLQGTPIEFEAIANSQSLTFSWDPPLGLSDPTKLKPSLIATEDEIYTLTATGAFGCTAKDFITVKVLKPVKIPNVFTPNGDGVHDKWMIPNLADYPASTVEVFNRYGQQVFYTAGYNKPWDGTFKGKDLPVGTYYYIIRLSNGYAPISGSVTIVR